MQASLRQVLRDSHVAAIAITVLIAGAVECLFIGLLDPASHVFSYLIAALATHNTPYGPRTVDYATHQVSLQMLVFDLSTMINNLACAWLLSLWAYGTGPLRVLCNYWERLSRHKHA